MARSVKLADDIMAIIRSESQLRNRSVAEQTEHWVNIGRAIERSRTFDYKRIKEALKAGISPDELRPVEQEVWFDQFTAKMSKPSQQEEASHRQRQKLGRGVGISSSGELIDQKKW